MVDKKKIDLKNKLKALKVIQKNYKIVLILIGNGKSSKVLFNDLEPTIKNLNQQKNRNCLLFSEELLIL